MSYCSNCGKNIEKEDVFCQKCGSRIDDFSSRDSSCQKSLKWNSNSNQTGLSNNRSLLIAILAITTIIIGTFVLLASVPPSIPPFGDVFFSSLLNLVFNI